MEGVSEYETKVNTLAYDVLNLSKNILLVKMRFLDVALNQLKWNASQTKSMSTDGETFFYFPKHVLLKYKSDRNAISHDYLHVVFHCIYRHMYSAIGYEQEIWDLACDIAVENSIIELGIPNLDVSKKSQHIEIIDGIKREIGVISAEKLYRYFKKASEPNDYRLLKEIFTTDNHSLWYAQSEKEEIKSSTSCGNDAPNDAGVLRDKDFEDSLKHKCIWEEIASRMQIELETIHVKQGNQAGHLVQNLEGINREKYDYNSFLRKFAVRSESIRINDEEFDYIFYMYGLKQYEKMPLIEPLEYKETYLVKDFVIAIDTSGSVSGKKVQLFVQKTYNILKSSMSFGKKMNLHIIQCDAKIQNHIKITTQEEFDSYLSNMEIRGLGGTDFRPVFYEVDRLIDNHEFANLRGMIYLTDGDGIFPERKPSYETAFVFLEDEYLNPEVPPWAIKMILPIEDIS